MELFLYLIFLDLDKMDIYRDNSVLLEIQKSVKFCNFAILHTLFSWRSKKLGNFAILQFYTLCSPGDPKIWGILQFCNFTHSVLLEIQKSGEFCNFAILQFCTGGVI